MRWKSNQDMNNDTYFSIEFSLAHFFTRFTIKNLKISTNIQCKLKIEVQFIFHTRLFETRTVCFYLLSFAKGVKTQAFVNVYDKWSINGVQNDFATGFSQIYKTKTLLLQLFVQPAIFKNISPKFHF